MTSILHDSYSKFLSVVLCTPHSEECRPAHRYFLLPLLSLVYPFLLFLITIYLPLPLLCSPPPNPPPNPHFFSSLSFPLSNSDPDLGFTSPFLCIFFLYQEMGNPTPPGPLSDGILCLDTHCHFRHQMTNATALLLWLTQKVCFYNHMFFCLYWSPVWDLLSLYSVMFLFSIKL